MTSILVNTGYILLLLNTILFSIKFASSSKATKIFTFYSGLIFVIQILANILYRNNINNLFLSHFYFIMQYFILAWFYYEILKERKQRRFIQLGIAFVSIALGIQYSFDPKLFFRFNLFEIFITSFMLIICATLHFYNMLNEKKEFYYINMGILIYLFGSTVLFLTGNLVANLTSSVNKMTWTANAALYVVYQVFIFVEWKKSYSAKKLLV